MLSEALLANTTALLIVDVQNDFTEGGILAAKNTATLMTPLNSAIRRLDEAGVTCIYSRDWHPPLHRSFDSMGGKWPTHCVEFSHGASFAANLYFPSLALLVSKGRIPEAEGYSAFEATGLDRYLLKGSISTLAVCGIATEYCVRSSALAALQHGFRTVVLTDLIRPIEVSPGDSERNLKEMQFCGAVLESSDDFIGRIT